MRRSRSRQPAQGVRAEAMRTPRQRFREVPDRKGWGMLDPRCIYIIARRTRGRGQYQMLSGGSVNRLDGNHVRDTTWSAYNCWPDSWSLYHNGKKRWYCGTHTRVSWDRPYGKYCQMVDAPLSQGSG